jgi:YD repeat-containing protein
MIAEPPRITGMSPMTKILLALLTLGPAQSRQHYNGYGKRIASTDSAGTTTNNEAVAGATRRSA